MIKNARRLAVLAAGLASAAALALGGTAHAATSVTALTHIQNDPDSGNGGTWATDQIDRTLSITANDDQSATPSGFIAYTATISDTGTFETLPSAFTPNQVIEGQRISHVVDGKLVGNAVYTILAPAADVPSTANVETNLNDNFNVPAAPQSVSYWPLQAFPSSSGVTVTLGNWSWSYTSAAGELWVDASLNGDGNLVQDGNITGLLSPPPVFIRLSHGQATATSPNRETVSFTQSGAASWDEFVIVGPGAINGHKGWIYGNLGTNFGYYSGLKANHGYTVYYTPVEGKGSDVQVPGSRSGSVYFVS